MAQNKEKRYLMIARVTPSELYYYQELMAALRGAIQEGTLTEFTAFFEEQQREGDLEPLS